MPKEANNMKRTVRTTTLIATMMGCVGMLTGGCGGSQPDDGQTAADQPSEAAPEVAADQVEAAPAVDRGPIEVPLRAPASEEGTGENQGESSSEDEGYEESGGGDFGEL